MLRKTEEICRRCVAQGRRGSLNERKERRKEFRRKGIS